MYDIKLNKKSGNFHLKKVQSNIRLQIDKRSITLNQTGRRGEPGLPGAGVPTGGSLGQVLTKQSNADFDTDWQEVPSAPVSTVNGQTGAVVLDKTDIGLGNVDNTSDVNKPMSSATQTYVDSNLQITIDDLTALAIAL